LDEFLDKWIGEGNNRDYRNSIELSMGTYMAISLMVVVK